MIRYIGLDLHKQLIVGCILDEAGDQVGSFRVEEVNSASLAKMCAKYLLPEDHVVMEATTHVWAVDRALRKHVAEVTVSNPVATKAIAQAKVKTDKIDAKVLAQLLRAGFLATVWKPDPYTSKLRELCSRRSRIVSQRTAIINRIRSVLAMRLLDCPHPIPSTKGHQWLKETELEEDARWMVESDLRMMDCVEKEIEAFDSRIAKEVYQDTNVKLLMTLPGVSVNVAVAILAAVGDISRFTKPEQLASYLGLVVTTRQSAKKCYHGSITKAGNVHARWSLVQAAHTAAKDLGPLGYFFNKLRRRKAYNVAITGLARKLAELVWHLLTTKLPYRYAKPETVQSKLSKLRVLGSGQKRKSGVAKGIDSRSINEGRDMKVRSPGLDEVLRKEGLPSTGDIPNGEKKHLERIGLQDLRSKVQEPKMRVKSRKQMQEVQSQDATKVASAHIDFVSVLSG
jgi:transposase